MNKKCFNHKPIWLFVIAFTILSISCSNGQIIDLSNKKKAGIIEKKVSNILPDSLGILESDLLVLPSFKRGIYYSPHIKHQAIGNRVLGIEFNDLEHLREQRKKLECEQPFQDSDMGSFICLMLNKNQYMSILAMASEDAFSTFTIRENGMWIDAGTFGSGNFSGTVPKIAYAFGKTPHEASLNVWTKALTAKSLTNKTALRYEKEYPEPFKYVGYCTWEHLKRNLDTEVLTTTMKKMSTAEVPLRWMLIDDGYEHHENSHLLSFQPDPTKFSNGFEPLKALKNEQGVKWLGLWWHLNGYFGGTSPKHTIGAIKNHMIELQPDFLVPKPNQESSDIFYETRAKEMSDAGIDFIKVDFQTDAFKNYRGNNNPVQAISYNHRGLEKAWQKHFKGLLNCIAQHHLHLFKHEQSSLIRSSIDYLRNDDNNAYIAVQNLRNSIYLGMTHWLDHDMFISSYHTGRSGAEVRAVCGSPIYISEDIDHVDFESIKPATTENGKIIRPIAPGTLTPEGFFSDPAETGLRVVAPLEGKVATFWLANFHNENDVELTLSPEDYRYGGTMIQPYEGLWKQPTEGLIAYDYHKAKAWKMSKPFSTKLSKWETKILHLIPLEKGWAVIGNPEKYLSPASCEIIERSKNSIKVTLSERSEFLIWSESGTPVSTDAKVIQVEDKLFRIEPFSGLNQIVLSRK